MWEQRNVVFDSNICRLCGCSSDRVYAIQNDVDSVEAMIKRLVPIKIDAKDKKPQQVCQECVTTLENYDSFISMCLTTDITFNNLLQSVKTTSTPSQESDRDLDSVQEEKIKPATEQRNSILLVSRSTENTPVQNQDFYLMLELNYKGVEIDPLLIKCNENNKTTDAQPRESNVQVIKCIELTKEANSTEITHKKREKTKPFKCNICNKSLSRKSNLISHLALHSDERPHKCLECGKNFAISTDLNLHKHIHTGLFTCDICKKCFITKSKLQRHAKTHSGVKEYSCSICKKNFAEKNNMTAHLTVHTGERPFACNICKKTFRTQSHLTDHKKVHSTDTPFKCNICDKSFKWKSNLRDHSKFHSGEKFSCNNCQNKFSFRGDYYKHRKTCQLVNKLVVCEFCSDIFPSESGCINHIQEAHKSEDFYQCELCNMNFPTIYLLKTHIESHETVKSVNEF